MKSSPALRPHRGFYLTKLATGLCLLVIAAVTPLLSQTSQASGQRESNQVRGSASETPLPPTFLKWDTRSKEDPLTRDVLVEATRNYAQGNEGFVNVTASCHIDTEAKEMVASLPTWGNQMQMMQAGMKAVSKDAPQIPPQNSPQFDARTLELQLRYHPKSDSHLALLLSPVGQSRCVMIGARVDEAVKEGMRSGICNVANLASIKFPAMHFRDAMGYGSGDDGNAVEKLSVGVINLQADRVENMSFPNVALMQDAFSAEEILVQLPLSDGNVTVVKIQPQEPTFQQFASRCESVFPDPPQSKSAEMGGPLGVSGEPDTIQIPSADSEPISVQGFRIMQAYADSPLQEFHIGLGDLIVSVNNKSVTTEQNILDALTAMPPGQKSVELVVYADGANFSRSFILNRKNLHKMPASFRKTTSAGNPR